MKLIISAVEDVIVDSVVNNSYIKSKPEKIKAEEILKLVKERTNGTMQGVDTIFLNMGPGSFTGIRASMALVVGLVAGKKINIIPFTSFDALEYDKLTADKVLAVNGFSNFVYVSYLKAKKQVHECIEIDKLKTLSKNKTILSSSDKILDFASQNQIKNQKVEFNLENVVKKHENKILNKIAFEPVYLRLSQAELQRKEKQK